MMGGFPLPLDIEESLFAQGYRYDLIHHIRSGYTRVLHGGRTYYQSKSIKEAHKTIEWLKKCGNGGDFEIREHIWPWDGFLTKVRKYLFGRVYYDSELKRTKSDYDNRLRELKSKYGG